MITSYTLKEGGILEYPKGIYQLITITDKGDNEIYAVMQKENSTCIQTKNFKRVGDKIKSGIDLGDCTRYAPPKESPQVGEEIILPCRLKAEISEIFGRTDDGGIACLVKIRHANSYHREVLYV